MPRRCAFGCKNINTAVRMHVFPNHDKFPERFKEWVWLAGGKLETSSDYEHYSKQRVCDVHFRDEHRNRYNRINALAVPTLHLPGKCASIAPADPPSDTTSEHKPTTSVPELPVVAPLDERCSFTPKGNVRLEPSYSVTDKPNQSTKAYLYVKNVRLEPLKCAAENKKIRDLHNEEVGSLCEECAASDMTVEDSEIENSPDLSAASISEPLHANVILGRSLTEERLRWRVKDQAILIKKLRLKIRSLENKLVFFNKNLDTYKLESVASANTSVKQYKRVRSRGKQVGKLLR